MIFRPITRVVQSLVHFSNSPQNSTQKMLSLSSCLLQTGRDVFAAQREEKTNLTQKVTGFEPDPDKRQVITTALKHMGFRWNPDEKAWTSKNPVEFEKVNLVIEGLKAISTETNPAAPQGSSAIQKKSPFETRIEELLHSWHSSLSDLLPRHIDKNRFFAALKVSLLNAERIASNSTDASLYTACSKCAQFGITPGLLQECYFSSREAQIEFQLGYKGLIALARRAVPNLHIEANIVRGEDTFSYTLGSQPTVNLSQNPDADPEDIRFAYVKLSFPDGITHLSVIDREHVKKRMQCSKGIGSPSSPWTKFQREMWLKTAIRDALRFTDLSADKNTKEELTSAVKNFRSVLSLAR